MKHLKANKTSYRSLRLSIFFTLANAVTFFHLPNAFGELAKESSSLEVAQYESCQQNMSYVTEVDREFNKACREADLGGRQACLETLANCEGEDAKDNDQCIEGMTTESDVKQDREKLEALRKEQDKLQESIKEQQGNIADYEQRAIDINRSKDEQRANLKQALADVGTQKALAQAKENQELEKIEIQVDQAKDQLVRAEFKLREFVLSKIDQCHEQAEKHRQEVYKGYVQAAQSGRVKYSHTSLFGMTGLSVKEIARIQGSNRMRRCMAMRVSLRDGNQITPYGMRYKLEGQKIEHEKSMLDKAISRMKNKRVEIQNANSATLASLSQVESEHIANYQRQVLRLNQEGRALIRQEKNALKEINRLQIKAVSLMLSTNFSESRLQKNHGKGIKIASDDKIKAFKEAYQARDSLESAAQRAKNGADRCKSSEFIQDILKSLGVEAVEAVEAVGV